MSRHHSAGTTLLVAGIMALGLGWASAASAKGKVPPSIDQILGVYQVTDKGVEYDLWSTDTWKWNDKGTCTITKVDPETINMHFVMPGYSWDDVCYYGDGGVIVTGSADDDTLGSWGYVQMLSVGGKPGKVKMKGTWMEYDLGDGWLDVGSVSLKQVG